MNGVNRPSGLNARLGPWRTSSLGGTRSAHDARFELVREAQQCRIEIGPDAFMRVAVAAGAIGGGTASVDFAGIEACRLGERIGERVGREGVDEPTQLAAVEDLDRSSMIGTDQQETPRCGLGKDHAEGLVHRQTGEHVATPIHVLETGLIEKAVEPDGVRGAEFRGQADEEVRFRSLSDDIERRTRVPLQIHREAANDRVGVLVRLQPCVEQHMKAIAVKPAAPMDGSGKLDHRGNHDVGIASVGAAHQARRVLADRDHLAGFRDTLAVPQPLHVVDPAALSMVVPFVSIPRDGAQQCHTTFGTSTYPSSALLG